ncbi:glycosyltransferase family 4 protein [Perlabentimonas gracilis]|uniref:glycosyltransferase family 4 protein n=1 Tax=Perlabentimonas gracilis TaxID=2715279 RepID=UPI00140BBAA9|nr:glycosyltransferase family 4 protein [Perlabentimonas gracilis]NHB67686.1 glycosyltransferase family 4 protein [Perlabentimonas gracilis]
MKVQKVYNILVCVSFVHPIISGDGNNAMALSSEFVSKGHSVTIVSLNPKNTLKNRTYLDGVKVYRTPYYKSTFIGKVLSRLLYITFVFFQILKSDTVIIFGRMLGFTSTLLISILLRKRIVFRSTLMDFDDPKTLCVGDSLSKRFSHFLFKNITIYYATTPSFGNRWTSIGLPPNKIFQKPSGINIDTFSPSSTFEKTILKDKIGLPQNTLIICSIGDLCFRKGYDSIALVLGRIKNPFIYIVLGIKEADPLLWGQKSNANEIETVKNILYSNLNERIILFGLVDNPQDFLKVSDVFLHFSNSEGLSNAMLQSMACGIPMVVKPIDGVLNYFLIDNENCLFACNWLELEKKTVSLLENENIRKTLGQNAHKCAVELFNISRITSDLLSRFDP